MERFLITANQKKKKKKMWYTCTSFKIGQKVAFQWYQISSVNVTNGVVLNNPKGLNSSTYSTGFVKAWYTDPETGEKEFADIQVKKNTETDETFDARPVLKKHCCLETPGVPTEYTPGSSNTPP